MVLRFIGKDGSAGFRRDRTYDLNISDRGDLIVVRSYINPVVAIPYSSPQSFAANWESPYKQPRTNIERRSEE